MMKELLSLLLISLSSVLAGDESSFTESIQAGFQQAKIEYGITDNTNLTTWDVQPVGLNFPCEVRSDMPTRATSVNQLTPYDIAVVGALGDSLTAGQGAGASSVLTVTTQYRGLSFSAGGDKELEDVTTLPNIVKKFNPKVKGYSTGKGNEKSQNAKNNCAVSGSKSDTIYDQAKELVEKIRTDTEINFELDWKLVTVFIGSNDLCAYCDDKTKYSPENYFQNVKKALDYLHENLPRTLVNLIQPIDVTRLEPIRGLWCTLVHIYACNCISGKTLEETSRASSAYQEQLGELVKNDRYEKEDFTVVIQPFLQGVELPYKNDGTPDKSYFAPDCFHFSTKSQAESAKALWNNMLEKVGDKNTGWQLGGSIKCPSSDSPYFYTKRNSNSPLFNNNQIDSQQDDDSTSSTSNLVAIATGSAVGVIVMVISVAILVTVIVAIVLRKRKNAGSSENFPLIKTQI